MLVTACIIIDTCCDLSLGGVSHATAGKLYSLKIEGSEGWKLEQGMPGMGFDSESGGLSWDVPPGQRAGDYEVLFSKFSEESGEKETQYYIKKIPVK